MCPCSLHGKKKKANFLPTSPHPAQLVSVLNLHPTCRETQQALCSQTYYGQGYNPPPVFKDASFPHPEPKKFWETAFFSFSIFFSPISSHSWGKRRYFGAGQKLSSPGSPCTTLSTSIRFAQAFGQSFPAIFTLHSSLVAVAFTASLNYYRG